MKSVFDISQMLTLIFGDFVQKTLVLNYYFLKVVFFASVFWDEISKKICQEVRDITNGVHFRVFQQKLLLSDFYN